GERRAGIDDDRPGIGAVLRRIGSPEKCAGHHDAELRANGSDHGAVGAGGIQPVFWRQWAGHWEFSACFFARDWRGSEPRLLRNDSPVNVHDLPADVRGYYSCADYRSDGGTDEVFRNCAV